MRALAALVALVVVVTLPGCGLDRADELSVQAGAAPDAVTPAAASSEPAGGSAAATPGVTEPDAQSASPTEPANDPARPEAAAGQPAAAPSKSAAAAASPPSSPATRHSPVPPQESGGGVRRGTPPQGLSLTLVIDRPTLRRDGTMTGTWTMRNTSSEPLVLRACDCYPEAGLYRGGKYVAGPSTPARPAVPPDDVTLAPGEQRQHQVEFTAYDHRQMPPRPAPPGYYDAAVSIEVDYEALFTPTVTVTVVQ